MVEVLLFNTVRDIQTNTKAVIVGQTWLGLDIWVVKMNSGELLTSDTILETPPNSSTSWVTYNHVNRHNNYAKHRNEHHFSVLKSALSEFATRASAGMIWIHILEIPLEIRLSFESMLTSDNLRNTFHSNGIAFR